MTLRNALLALLTTFFVYSCSSSEGLMDSSTSSGLFPDWYSASLFEADSVSFSGFGLAIAADSTSAIQRASDDALKNLDIRIGNLAEDVRTKLVSDGVTAANNTDFILILRNAHADAIRNGIITEYSVVNEEGNYRAFAKAELSRSELINLLEEGFTGHPRYWASYSESSIFQSVFN